MQSQRCALATSSGSLTAPVRPINELLDLTLNVFLDPPQHIFWTAAPDNVFSLCIHSVGDHLLATTFLRWWRIVTHRWPLHVCENVVLQVFFSKDCNHLLLPIRWLGTLPCSIGVLDYWLNIIVAKNLLSCFHDIVHIMCRAVCIGPPNGLIRFIGRG